GISIDAPVALSDDADAGVNRADRLPLSRRSSKAGSMTAMPHFGISRLSRPRPRIALVLLTSDAMLVVAGPAGASARLMARDDAYQTRAGQTLNVNAGQGVLANDRGRPLTFIVHSDPAHGTLTLQPNGSFSYVPAQG